MEVSDEELAKILGLALQKLISNKGITNTVFSKMNGESRKKKGIPTCYRTMQYLKKGTQCLGKEMAQTVASQLGINLSIYTKTINRIG
jgi:hypothetical protein